jgi:hypothetical protein
MFSLLLAIALVNTLRSNKKSPGVYKVLMMILHKIAIEGVRISCFVV